MNFVWESGDPSAVKLFRVISALVRDNEHLLKFLFDRNQPRLRARAGLLREESWAFPEEDQLLIRVALDIWSGSGHVQLWELAEAWDKEQWEAFARAVRDLPPR